VFKYSDRHRKDAIVLVSGWAFDERIFSGLDLPFNVISYGKMYMGDFEIDLLDFLNREKLSRVSLLGWSQGALACAHFAAGHPEYIRELTLVSLRPAYDQASLDPIKLLLQRNRRAYLRQFYKTCFSGVDLEAYRWFKRTLQNEYLDKFLEKELCRGLDWLSQAGLCADALKTVPSLTVIHGHGDQVAPVQGVVDLVAKLPQAELILLREGGHIPFLSSKFKQHWHGQ
jgi:pimeloyl-[acyl-carrier protein] methyl ester esterase